MTLIYPTVATSSVVTPYELDRFKLARTEAEAGATSADVTISIGDKDVLITTLTIAADGTISLYDLAPLIIEHLDGAGLTSFYMEVGCGSRATDIYYTILPCKVPLSAPASSIANALPLTRGGSNRSCVWGEKVYFSAFFQQGAAHVKFYVYDARTDSKVYENSPFNGVLSAPTVKNFALRCNWHAVPLEAHDNFYIIVDFYARGGNVPCHTLRFDSLPAQSVAASVVYENAFFANETLHFPYYERQQKPTYNAAVVNGRRTNYLVERGTKWTGYSGPLTKESALAFEDLQCSEWLQLEDGTEIVATESELKYLASQQEMLRGSVTWEEANGGDTWRPTGGNVFDETFDETFD